MAIWAICKKMLRAALCAVLACSMAFAGFVRTVVAAEDSDRVLNSMSQEEFERAVKTGEALGEANGAKLYVSDIMIGTGYTEAEAKSAITRAGYYVFGQNLNEGAGGYEKKEIKYTYIGYKLTSDRSKAITNISLMDQNGGYEPYSYYEKAKEMYAGLADATNLMQRACREFTENLKKGNKNAVAAKECLNIFCVPKTSKEFSGPLFGDYLTTGSISAEKCEELLLVLNTLITNITMTQIAIANIDTTLETQKIEGTEIVSETGVCGYSDLTDAGNWLADAYNALETKTVKGENGEDVEQKNIPGDDSDTAQDYFDQIYVLNKAMNGGFSEAAVSYLKSVKLKGKIDFSTGYINASGAYSVYDFLKEAPRGALAGFLRALPEVCGLCHFTEVLEICAADASHRIPKTLKTNFVYHVNWIDAITKGIGALGYDPYNANTRNIYEDTVSVYREEINAFVVSLQTFFDQYDRAVKESAKGTNSDEAPLSEEELIAKTASTGEIDGSGFCPELYLGLYKTLEKFEVSVLREGRKTTLSLAEYFKQIDTAYRASLQEKSSAAEKEQSRWIYSALAYPIITSLTNGQWFALRTNMLETVIALSLLTEKELYAMREKYKIIGKELTEEDHVEAFSVWNNTNRELIEAENVAMTSDQTQRTFEEKLYSQVTSNYQTAEKRHVDSLIKCGLVAAGCVAGVLIAFTIYKVAVAVTVGAFSTGGILAIGAGGIAVTCSLIIGAAFTATFAVVLIVALGFLIAWLVEHFKTPKPTYSSIPTLMMDCVTDINNTVISHVNYYVVRDQYGNPADINGFNAKKWTVLYYTTDPKGGSPLTCNASGSYFGSVMGNTSRPDDSCPLAKFTRYDPFNLNNNCYKDTVGGIYVWFFTEDSLNHIFKTGLRQKYVAGIRIAVGKTAEAAMSSLAMAKGYYVIEHNLAPSSKYFVYVAYSTTKDPDKALRDIRVAYGTMEKELYYGQLKYANVLPEGMEKCPLETCDVSDDTVEATAFSYTLFTAQIEASSGIVFGDPILSNGFEVVDSIDEIDEDSEVVTLFGGGAFDFDSWDGEEYDSFDTQKFLTFKYEYGKEGPYSKRPNATEYVSGISFFSGSTDWYPSAKNNTLQKYAYSMGYHILDSYDLTGGILNHKEDVTYLAYTTTYNPIRAITDFGIFTAEPKSSYLPLGIVSNGIGYVASPVLSQGDKEYYDDDGRQRLMRKSHAYFTNVDDEAYHTGWGSGVSLMARGLYSTGYQVGVRGLTTADITFSFSKSEVPTVNGKNGNLYYIDAADYVNINDRRVNRALGEGWKSVHPLEQYYYDSYDADGNLTASFNMGLDDSHVFCLYVRNETIPNRVRGNYIASAQIVSSMDAGCSFDNARINAMGNGAEIVNIASPMQPISSAYPDVMRESAVYRQEPKDLIQYTDGCFYVVVSYTDVYDDGLGGIRVVEQKQGETKASKLTLPLTDGAQKDYVRGTLAALTAMGPDFNLGDDGKPLGDKELIKKRNSRAGYYLYTVKSGTPISRLCVQKTTTVGSAGQGEWHEKEADAAEYFLQADDTFEPFCMQAYGSGVRQYIAARRYDFSTTQNKYRYISDIAIVRVSMHDRAFHTDAAEAGASDYPFYVESNLLDGQIGDPGNMESVVIAFKRVADAKKAIKNVKFSSDDLGEFFEYQTLTYQRANSEPLRIAGFGNESIYIYYTKEVGADDFYTGPKVLWEDLYNDPDTDWENIDWRTVDLSTIDTTQFSGSMHTPIGSESLRTYRIATGALPDTDGGLNQEAFAVRDVGLYVGEDEILSWASSVEEVPERMANPASRSDYSRDSAAKHEVLTFDGKSAPIRMVFTNAANRNFDEALEAFFRGEETEKNGFASAFAKENLPVLLTLLGVFVVGLGAAAWVAFSKKKKEKNNI